MINIRYFFVREKQNMSPNKLASVLLRLSPFVKGDHLLIFQNAN